jgi:Histidine kinase-, DNA gyrase B-, and HSP90-like ATPase
VSCTDTHSLKTVNIRPGVSVLSVLRHLNYRAWFALAEFVDNSLQSYLEKRAELEALHGPRFKLKISIELDASTPPRLSIRDNAAGIAQSEFSRAFRPAAIPPDLSGLSEFGMGMKSAACWFASRWHVRTKALGEPIARIVHFDVERIVNDQIEELEIESAPSSSDAHFTEVVMDNLHHVPVKKTLSKIKEHLSDIYRVFIRDRSLDLVFNGEHLIVEEPSVLRAPFVREPNGPIRTWRKPISFDFGDDLKVNGFAALRDPGNYARSGFALFRRGRLIQGSGDEGYRPPMIFAQPGSYRYLRLFGELHMEGFEVSHTKDGFRWDENEQPFIELLKEHLDSDDLPLLRQADGYRVIAAREERTAAAREAVDRTTTALQQQPLPEVLNRVAGEPPIETRDRALDAQPMLASKEINIDFRGERWRIKVELGDDPAEGQWLAMSDSIQPSSSERVIEIRVSLAHPFMVSFAQTDPDDVEALLRVASALALAETLARRTVRMAGTVRRNLNEILLEALSQPAT